MIRNYYTDSYKSGIAVTPSDTLLLDGRTKSTTPQGAWKEYNIYVGNSPAGSKMKVHTINDEVIEFVTPAQGFVLPVSVVQVYATDTEGGISNLVALS